MKNKKLLIILACVCALVIIAVSIIVAINCKGNQGQNTSTGSIKFNTLTVDGETAYGKVGYKELTFSFVDEITADKNTTFVVDNNKDLSSPIESKVVNLEVGDNIFYLSATSSSGAKLFKVTIRRKPLYEVTYITNANIAVKPQAVEEDTVISAPNVTNPGYTLVGWDYDFTTPITKDTVITATWKPNTDTPYTVNYYWENADNDEFTLHDSVKLTATTGDSVNAQIKTFDHFTLDESQSQLTGEVAGDGSLVLDLYYLRESFTIETQPSIATAGSCSIDSGVFHFGKELTLTAYTNLGYNFIGWYNGNTLVSEAEEFTFTVNSNATYTATWEDDINLVDFSFTSTPTTCEITRVKFKDQTQLVVPDYVTSIQQGAFYGCNELVSLTIPFVGSSAAKTSQDSYQYPFGYIFGQAPYLNATSTDQYYLGESSSSLTSTRYFIPNSLKTVTITGGNILYGAFYGCANLETINLPQTLTSIGENSFNGCSGLKNISIPSNVTTIAAYAFNNCNLLESVTFADDSKLSSIDEGAFYGCGNLKNISIPASVQTICPLAFFNCRTLESVTFKGTSQLTTIQSQAFGNCANLNNVVLPDGLSTIGDYCFNFCENLTSLSIPSSLTKIEYYALQYCSQLTTITYRGTIAMWNAIEKGSSWDYETGNYTITCTDGNIPKDSTNL